MNPAINVITGNAAAVAIAREYENSLRSPDSNEGKVIDLGGALSIVSASISLLNSARAALPFSDQFCYTTIPIKNDSNMILALESIKMPTGYKIYNSPSVILPGEHGDITIFSEEQDIKTGTINLTFRGTTTDKLAQPPSTSHVTSTKIKLEINHSKNKALDLYKVIVDNSAKIVAFPNEETLDRTFFITVNPSSPKHGSFGLIAPSGFLQTKKGQEFVYPITFTPFNTGRNDAPDHPVAEQPLSEEPTVVGDRVRATIGPSQEFMSRVFSHYNFLNNNTQRAFSSLLVGGMSIASGLLSTANSMRKSGIGEDNPIRVAVLKNLTNSVIAIGEVERAGDPSLYRLRVPRMVPGRVLVPGEQLEIVINSSEQNNKHLMSARVSYTIGQSKLVHQLRIGRVNHTESPAVYGITSLQTDSSDCAHNDMYNVNPSELTCMTYSTPLCEVLSTYVPLNHYMEKIHVAIT